MVGDAAELPGEEFRRAPQLRQFAPEEVQISLEVPSFPGRFHRPAGVEEGARYVQQVRVVLIGLGAALVLFSKEETEATKPHAVPGPAPAVAVAPANPAPPLGDAPVVLPR